MRISFKGQLVDEPEIRAGFIGCGSHSFRNIYPTFQFAPVNLVATCDLDLEKAKAFAAKFGAQNAYDNYHQMLEQEDIDAVFVVAGYDERGKPRYPGIAIDCLNAERHVWIEKPPAATCDEIRQMQEASEKSGKNVLVGMKKMFFPANVKAKQLMGRDDFGQVSLVQLEYPQGIPTQEEFRLYMEEDQRVLATISFLDHVGHPFGLLVYLMGMPSTLYYERAPSGAGAIMFTFPSGAIATMSSHYGSASRDKLERTMIVSDAGRHIVVDNNIRVTYHRIPRLGYGDVPDFYVTEPDETTTIWEPEFSLGQLYNKGLFLLGYYSEVNEFARSILDKRAPANGTLEQAWQVTRIFEAFAEGPGHVISLT